MKNKQLLNFKFRKDKNLMVKKFATSFLSKFIKINIEIFFRKVYIIAIDFFIMKNKQLLNFKLEKIKTS